MNTILIVLAVVIVVGGVALLVTSPMLRRKEGEAVGRVKEILGADDIDLIEPRANGFGTDPERDDALRGMGVLAANAEQLVFVTWAPQREFHIQRSTITEVTSSTANVEEANKAMIEVTFTDDGSPVTAKFRLTDPVTWIDALSPG